MKLPGWKHVAGAVYDHESGVRVHTAGLVRLPSGEMFWGGSWPESQVFDRYVRICGGSRRRGAMAWANDIAPRLKPGPLCPTR